MADSKPPVSEDAAAPLLRTPLHAEHVAAGARMVGFAGYDMPVQYPNGILAEHLWTRQEAGLFDVSHMGQAFLVPEDGSFETAARALEALVPADLLSLKPGQQRYSQLLAEDGGILDDLMVTRVDDEKRAGFLYLVVNAGTKEADYAHIESRLPQGVTLQPAKSLALVALQGSAAEAVAATLDPSLADLPFMGSADRVIGGLDIHVSRSGYTGEDGFEISVRGEDAVALWSMLAADGRVKPVGLGARDSLRLEAGLCLYGHDIDPTTSPIEAGLAWSIQKRRRAEGGFLGFERVRRELAEGPPRKRVGIRPEGKAPVREGAPIVSADGAEIGRVTSGGFGPTIGGPVAMGYVEAAHAAPGTPVALTLRGRAVLAAIATMPFAPHRYKRG